MALTELSIEKLKPGPSRREIPDGLISGLYLVLQPSGAKSWAVRYRVGGATRKHTIDSYPKIGLKAARELARNAFVEVAKGNDPGVEKKAKRAAEKLPPDRDLVENVAETFVERYAKAKTRESSWRETDRILKKEVVAKWQGRRIGEIGRADIHELLDGITDRGKAIMANRTLAAVRKMFGWAVERGLVDTNPCDKIKAPSEERSRDRVLTDDELRTVWFACDKIGWPFGPLLRLLILTGQRRDEVGSMRWEEVDLEAKLWTLPRERAKNNKAHTVPLSPAVLAILSALPRVGPYVFSTNGRTAVAGFSKAKERVDRLLVRKINGEDVGPPRWTLHDFRRTVATGMARLGVGLPVIERVLNHVSGSFGGIVGVYQRHSFADEKAAALEKWGCFVERLAAGQSNVVIMARSAS